MLLPTRTYSLRLDRFYFESCGRTFLAWSIKRPRDPRPSVEISTRVIARHLIQSLIEWRLQCTVHRSLIKVVMQIFPLSLNCSVTEELRREDRQLVRPQEEGRGEIGRGQGFGGTKDCRGAGEEGGRGDWQDQERSGSFGLKHR